jgi:UDP-N-acetylmuramoyl-tripeptide--D-alanyl-D-alanine ligase
VTIPPLWTAQSLREATGGTPTAPFAATGVSIDTRTLVPGDLFVALVGENGDGHRFVADALAKGAAGAMVHQDVPVDGPLLRVDDTLAALTRLGGSARARFTGRVVAITGSVGKTTTKEMLRCILSAAGPTHAAVASYNNHWGVPLTLARLPLDAAFCVVEIGMNHAGEIAPLSRLAQPQVAVITAVEKAHIGYLGSIEAIADEKASIVAGLAPRGVAVLPADSPMFPRLRAAAERAGARVVTFGAHTAAANIRLVDIAMDADGSDVMVETDGGPVRFRLKAPGRHMAMNALAAIGAADATVPPSWPGLTRSTADSPSADGRVKPYRHEDKAAPEQNTHPLLVGGGSEEGAEQEDVCVSTPAPAPPPTRGGVFLGSTQRPYPDAYGDEPRRDASVVHALGTFAPVSGRGTRQPIALPGGTALLLDESYNGNGASIRAALGVLRLQPARRRIAVLGDMLELGDAGPAEHAALAIEAATAADLVFACGPLMRHLFDALPPHRRGAHATDSAALAPLVVRAIAPGDAILVKGSLGSRMRRVVEALDSAATHTAEEAA